MTFDQLASGVRKLVLCYGSPAFDPDFYQVKKQVRAYLAAARVKNPFVAIEPARGPGKTMVTLAVGNDVTSIRLH